jgi:hypothetical protein
LTMTYSGGLKIRNNHSSGSLGAPFYIVWVGSSHKKWLRRGKGWQQRAPLLSKAPFFLARSSSKAGVETKH